MFQTSKIGSFIRLKHFFYTLLIWKLRNYRIHDFDNNTKLDGLEILHALQHTMHENEEEGIQKPEEDWIVGTFQFHIFRKYTYIL